MATIGAHVSVAGGLYKGIESAKYLGAEAIQIFGSSSRQWKVAMPAAGDIARYKKSLAASGVRNVYLHAPYLVNLASSDEVMLQKSVDALSGHLKIASLLGAEGVIFHVGSGGTTTTKATALARAADAIIEVLSRVSKAKLFIENTAGGGQKIGATPAEIGELINKVSSDRVGTCFDTAHAYEAGLLERYDVEELVSFFDAWSDETGQSHPDVLHINDSKTAFKSHHDRHENIGEGYIGLEGFKNLAREKRVRDLPWILEVPGFDDNGPDRRNMDILQSCFS